MEKAMEPHSSTLAWKIPWMEEPGRLQSMGSWRVGHNWTTSLSLFTFMHWRRKWQPTQCSCLENPRDGGAWWAAVYGVAQSRTRLERLSSSRDLFKKIRDTKGTFHAKMGSIKDRNVIDLTEAEDMKKSGKNTQKNCTKKVFMTQIITMVWSFTESQTSWNVKSSGP